MCFYIFFYNPLSNNYRNFHCSINLSFLEKARDFSFTYFENCVWHLSSSSFKCQESSTYFTISILDFNKENDVDDSISLFVLQICGATTEFTLVPSTLVMSAAKSWPAPDLYTTTESLCTKSWNSFSAIFAPNDSHWSKNWFTTSSKITKGKSLSSAKNVTKVSFTSNPMMLIYEGTMDSLLVANCVPNRFMTRATWKNIWIGM